ncbi:MAG: formylmethanofuran dehydrogenase subunit A [Anaerolineales bacterium]|nr:formylmethanofuran dehydrogenase subunit A [Anaerolineales bacterium]
MICLRGGKLIDPLNHRDGVVDDIWIQDGRIVAAPENVDHADAIDASSWLVTPGGIEIHSHIVGTQMATARSFSLEENTTSPRLLMTPAEINRAYLKMGYTTVFDAAMSPLMSRIAHTDLDRMMGLDRGAYTLVSDQSCVLKAIKNKNSEELKHTLAWLLECTRGYALKLVNPGVGLTWRALSAIGSLDDPLADTQLTQREIILALAEAAQSMGLPHPIHLHASNLGQPGNWKSFCQTVKALEGLPAHFCHIQFYCYGKDDKGRMRSAAEEVVEIISDNPKLTFDAGEIVFGPAMAMTCDLQLIEWLHRMGSGKWTGRLLEGEGGMGLLPLQYAKKDPSSAVQWATGLELLLRFPDPERLFLTTDYPNGGPFTDYPRIIAWLMDAELRQRMLAQVHPAARTRCGLEKIEREYSLFEVVQMTSAGPAKALGLQDRGHLGIGAQADIRCYQPQSDKEAMFSNPVLVIKGGDIAIREGEYYSRDNGRLLAVQPAWDRERLPAIQRQLQESTSLDPRFYGLSDKHQIPNLEIIPCK